MKESSVGAICGQGFLKKGRPKFAILMGLVLAFFTGASEWEGSAIASVDGDMPASGFFAATNSFPRNTAIDVTNLENGLTVRAVVSHGLDTPGLLVVLSKEAAEAIGLAPQSLRRVLMSQAPEAVGGQAGGNVFAHGDPDFDPAANVIINGGLDPALLAEMEVLLEAEIAAQQAAELAAGAPAETEPPVQQPVPVQSEAEGTVPGVAAQRPLETGEANVPAETGVQPEAVPSEPSATIADRPPLNGAVDNTENTESESAVSAPAAEIAQPAQPETTVPGSQPASPDFGYPPAAFPDSPPESLAQVPPALPNYDSSYNFYVEPTGPRIPPSAELYIDPKDIVVPLDQYPKDFYPDYYPNNLFPGAAEYVPPIPPPPAYSAAPVPQYPPAYPSPWNVIPPVAATPPVNTTPPRPPEREYYIDPAYIIPPIGESAPAAPAAPPEIYVIPPVPPAAAPVRNFSVREITSLEKGSYYIQVMAGAEAEGIESEIRKISRELGQGYPMVVQPANTASGGRLYRLMIGPVNRGESGALLERFKASYKDAFVRVGS